jgi:glycoside/pentoside/hexuronide:cation symporter, GPH family
MDRQERVGTAMTDIARPALLTNTRKLGWASGDFGFNIFWQALNLLMLPFYTDVLGLEAGLAGTVFLIASLWDGFADTIIAAIADRTRSRWGSYRPYLIFASPLLVVAFMLSFLTPDAPQLGLFLYALLSQVFLRTAYSFVSIPYSSLSARISGDANERASMAGWRMTFAFAGGALVTFAMPTLIAWLGEPSASAYVLAAGLVGVISLPFFWLCFATTSEPPALVEANPAGFSMAAIADDVRAMVAIGRANGPLMRIFGCIIVSSLAFTMTNKCLVYYVTYYLERPDLVPQLVPFALIMNLAFAPFWGWLAQHLSKRSTWLVANAVSAVAYTVFFLVPSRDPLVAAALIGVISAANVAYQVLFWAMLPDTVEYNLWKTGQRHDAKVFGFASFAKQLALGLNGALLGLMLTGIGYVPNVDQSEATLWGLKAVMALVPLTGVAISAMLVWGYQLDRHMHARISAEPGGSGA